MKWDCLIHATDLSSLKKIKESKRLLSPENNRYRKYDDMAPFVYTTYMFSELDSNYYRDWVFDKIILMIRPEIFRDQPFIACSLMNYGLGCLIKTLTTTKKIMEGEGNLKTIPNLTKLKNSIKNMLKNDEYDDNDRFNLYTHEVIFESIPIEYIVCILCSRKEDQKDVHSLFPTIPSFHIPYLQSSKSKIKGIEHFNKYVLPFFSIFGNRENFQVDPIKSSHSLDNMKKKLYPFTINILKESADETAIRIKKLDKTQKNYEKVKQKKLNYIEKYKKSINTLTKSYKRFTKKIKK